MKTYDQLKIRYAKTLHRMYDFGVGDETSSKPVRIASVLLISSVFDCLSKLKRSVDRERNAVQQPLSKIDKKIVRDHTQYEVFLNSIGGISASIASFLKTHKQSASDSLSSTLAADFLKKLFKSLKAVVDLADSVVLKQEGNSYYLFEDQELKRVTEEMLRNVESSGLIQALRSIGHGNIARQIEAYKKHIQKEIDQAEKQSKIKQRNGIPNIDPDSERDIITKGVA